ncbi:site-specific integrase [Flagellimonas sp.]|uniref:site-specific integrase n=1 Tax=Flagellimonas sp. TaxID=2058762 RepID=UPI003B50A3AA
MSKSFSILFYLKKRPDKNSGLGAIYLRITVDSKRAEVSVYRKVKVLEWSPEGGMMKGSHPNAVEMNKYLDEIRHKVYGIHSWLIKKDKTITAKKIKELYMGKKKIEKTLITLYKEHNDKILELVGREYSKGRYYQHNRTMRHLEKFIKKEYNKEDIPIKKVDLAFIRRFEHYLKVSNAGGKNTVTKYVTNFKKIIRIAFANSWIKKDPFYHWKATWKPVEREVLTEMELKILMEREFDSPKLNHVRDVFLFCCFTGLSYIDVQRLTADDIVIDMNGQRWIKIKRKKTDTKSSVPLLPAAQQILDKYREFHVQSPIGQLLPVMSNQKLNEYLKQIAGLCCVNKRITFHLSRHTFATTVTLANGVPIESVSKMLGHSCLKTTQIYAKVVDRKLAKDMDLVKAKFKFSR